MPDHVQRWFKSISAAQARDPAAKMLEKPVFAEYLELEDNLQALAEKAEKIEEQELEKQVD